MRASNYEIAPLLETIFLSKDFYSPASMATHIKSPVELVISTYRKMGLVEVPGVPDFNDVTEQLGQKLLYPPTVAGWANGKKERHLMALPAYDQCIKASHVFNLLDARGVISVTERQSYILRVRELAKACGEAWLATEGGGAS